MAKRKLLSLAFVFFFLPCLAKALDNFSINIHLLQATLEHELPLKQVEVLTTLSRHELSALRDKVVGSEYELASAIDILLDIYDIEKIEDLFSHEKAWNEWRDPLLDNMVIGDPASYSIKLSPKKLPLQQITLHAAILRTKKKDINKGWETIIKIGCIL